jgi:glycosyltransferase involved in cell wall biosynthesis
VKVAFTIDPFTRRGGGSFSFARTLAEHLGSLKIPVSFDLRIPADVVLLFANQASLRHVAWQHALGARILHRLDERIDPAEDPGRRAKHRHLIALNAFADMTLFQSHFVEGNIGPHLERPSGIVIHNGVDTTLFRPDGPRVPLEGRPSILHTTWSVGASKRIDRLQQLLDLPYPDLVLHLVGRHEEAEGSWKNDPRVRFHGSRDSQQVAQFMRSADIFFFPSENDPCSNTVLEAMACGIPILYHPSGGTPELVGDAGVCLEPSVAAAVERALAARDELHAGCLRRAQEFRIETVAKKYVEAMETTCTLPRGRGPGAARTARALFFDS